MPDKTTSDPPASSPVNQPTSRSRPPPVASTTQEPPPPTPPTPPPSSPPPAANPSPSQEAPPPQFTDTNVPPPVSNPDQPASSTSTTPFFPGSANGRAESSTMVVGDSQPIESESNSAMRITLPNSQSSGTSHRSTPSSASSLSTNAVPESGVPPPNRSPSSDDGGLSTGAIIAIAVGAVALLVIILLFAFCIYRRRRTKDARIRGLLRRATAPGTPQTRATSNLDAIPYDITASQTSSQTPLTYAHARDPGDLGVERDREAGLPPPSYATIANMNPNPIFRASKRPEVRGDMVMVEAEDPRTRRPVYLLMNGFRTVDAPVALDGSPMQASPQTLAPATALPLVSRSQAKQRRASF